MQYNKYGDFEVGQKGSLTKTFSEKDVLDFSKLSKDENPIHFDKEYALKSRFEKRIVQGPFVASLFGGILGSDLPGAGTIYMNQNTNFKAPVFIGDTVTAHVEIKSVREDKPIIKLRTWVTRDEEVVIDGDATILFLKNQE
jgi:acyl dehydratase